MQNEITRYNARTLQRSRRGQSLQKTGAGIESLKTLAAQSRITAKVCGFFVRAPVYGGLNRGAQARRLMASASVPVFQPCSSRHPIESGCAVFKPTQLEANHG
jgi:hypothetical protein